MFPNPACLNLQQRFERFKRWRFLTQVVQARKHFSDGLQASLQAAQAMLISGNCHCGPVCYQKSLAAGCAMGSGIECITKVLSDSVFVGCALASTIGFRQLLPLKTCLDACSNRLQTASNPQAIWIEAQTSLWRRKSWFEPAYKRLAWASRTNQTELGTLPKPNRF